MGGNEQGQPDNDALLKTLDINHQLLQGVANAMKSSFTVNAVVKYNTMLDGEKTEAALKELEAKLKKSEHGFLPLDLKNEFIPIKKEIAMVERCTIFGVSFNSMDKLHLIHYKSLYNRNLSFVDYLEY